MSIAYFFLLAKAVVVAGLFNAARYKPAIQSSDWPPYYAYLGVDGDYDDNLYNGHCFHTNQEYITWWMVDLRGQFTVEMIQLTNRGDNGVMNAERLRNFEIDIFEDDPRKLINFPSITGHLCYNQTTPVDPGTFNFTCSVPLVGRFVRLVMKREVLEYLHVCEIEVLVSGASYEEIDFNMKHNYKFSGSSLVIFTAMDQFMCLRECLLCKPSIYCTSVNWVQSTRSCELFSVNPFIDLSSNLTLTPGTNLYLQN